MTHYVQAGKILVQYTLFHATAGCYIINLMSLLMSYTRCLYLVIVVYCVLLPVLLTLVVFHPCVSPACAVLVISCVILFYFTLHLLVFAAIGLFTTVLLSDPCSVIQSTSTVYIIPRGAAYHQAKMATASGPQASFCACVCVCEEVPHLIPLAHGEQTNLMTTAKATT